MKKTYWCKGCQRLEETQVYVDPKAITQHTVNGVTYPAVFLHAVGGPVVYDYPAFGFNNETAAHALMRRKFK